MKRKDYFWGLFLVVVAIALLGNAFQVFTIGPSLFRILISAALVAFSIASMPRLKFFGIIMPLALVLIINDRYFNLHGQNWTVIWAGLFLSAGLSLIFKRRRLSINHKKYQSYSDGEPQTVYEAEFSYTDENGNTHTNSNRTENTHGDYIEINAIFTDRSRYVRSDNLSGGTIDNTFGALRVYFDGATLNPNGAELNVSCTFGQLILYIPHAMEVINNIETTLAGVSDERRFSQGNGPRLVINGDVTFGEIKIVYI